MSIMLKLQPLVMPEVGFLFLSRGNMLTEDAIEDRIWEREVNESYASFYG